MAYCYLLNGNTAVQGLYFFTPAFSLEHNCKRKSIFTYYITLWFYQYLSLIIKAIYNPSPVDGVMAVEQVKCI